MKTLILYFTTDGQTKKIADKLAEQINHDVEVISLQDQAVNFVKFFAKSTAFTFSDSKKRLFAVNCYPVLIVGIL